MTELGGVDGEEDFIEHDFSRVFFEGDDGKFGAVFGGRGEPDAVSDDDGGGPSFAVNRGFPFHVLIFPERGGDAFGPRRGAVGVGSAKLGPVGGEEWRGGEQE